MKNRRPLGRRKFLGAKSIGTLKTLKKTLTGIHSKSNQVEDADQTNSEIRLFVAQDLESGHKQLSDPPLPKVRFETKGGGHLVFRFWLILSKSQEI